MSNQSNIVTTKDIFQAIKDEYINSGDWYEKSENEIHKDVEDGRSVMIRLDGNLIDMRLSRTGYYTSMCFNPHDRTEFRESVEQVKHQFRNTEAKWRDNPTGW